MLTPQSQFRYFESLQATVKFTLAAYFVLFLGGILLLAIGIDRLISEVRDGRIATVGLLIFVTGFLFLAAVYLLGRVNWVTTMHGWLDRRFFRLLDKSNGILLDGLVIALDPDEQQAIKTYDIDRRQSLARMVFSTLAQNDSLFRQVLNSGIFRLWVWYWAAMYGTFVFTVLTLLAFPVIIQINAGLLREFFTLTWILSLLHFVLGIYLGNRLLRLMREVAELLLRQHRDEIVTLIRDQVTEYAVVE